MEVWRWPQSASSSGQLGFPWVYFWGRFSAPRYFNGSWMINFPHWSIKLSLICSNFTFSLRDENWGQSFIAREKGLTWFSTAKRWRHLKSSLPSFSKSCWRTQLNAKMSTTLSMEFSFLKRSQTSLLNLWIQHGWLGWQRSSTWST